jgi:hypothetical protein
MPTHLYCLFEASDAPTAEPPVRALDVAGLIAWVASTEAASISREGRRAAANAVEHDRVIARGLVDALTPLPATLADAYADDAAAIRDIASRSAEVRAALARVAGQVEMAVILASRNGHASDAAPSSSPGRDYLDRSRNLPRELSAVGDEIDRRVGHLVTATARRPSAGRLALSHLIRRTDIDDYRRTVLSLASGQLRMVIDGPRAPYSFAAFAPKIEGP